MAHKVFGCNPTGSRLQRIRQSPNYRERSFQNLARTPVMAEDGSFWKTMKEYFNKPRNREPQSPLPTVKTDLGALDGKEPVLVWFGHSSYFLAIGGYRILVDPVFSNHASPVSFMVKGFRGTGQYAAKDALPVDLLIQTHDHYDHLDYKSINILKPGVRLFSTALGVGSHLEYWGIKKEKITEFDWWERKEVLPGMTLTAAPARHFSGRGLRRGKTLWTSFVLECAGLRIYIGGDSGYGSHFTEIGKRYGPFDLAILEAGQYNKNWPHIHMMPEETVKACQDLGGRLLMPVHWGRFSLALHPWYEPIRRVAEAAALNGLPLAAPKIGEAFYLRKAVPGSPWWETMK